MRAGAKTLSALITNKPKQEACSSALFVFTNKRRNLIKVFSSMGLRVRL